MTGVLKWLAVVIMAATAAVLCYQHSDGWGWFLFVAFLIATA